MIDDVDSIIYARGLMKTGLKLLAVLIFTIFSFNCAVFADEAPKLAGYQADLSQTSVSGLSSGAFMTAQFHVAYSDLLVGAGIIAGGPFYCVGSYDTNPNKFLLLATSMCMNPLTNSVGPDGERLWKKAKKFAQENKIADLKNLKDDKVYIFSGSNDKTVKTIVVDEVEDFYRAAGVPPENIKYNNNINAGHAIIVESAKVECPDTDSPFINDCDFMQSHQILAHIYGQLNPPADSNKLSGKIIEFDQSEFIDAENTSMSKEAYVYVPKVCETETCKVHVAIHGCRQGAAVIGDTYYTTTGYNEIADTNKIIVLYPQVEPSQSIPFNPKGCWDFWGYSSADPEHPTFYTRESPQMKAIVGMLKRLAEPSST
jgi:predicted peptidase